ncbi:MAG TPA: NAD-dependent epimerase/dehydratase family protein [Bryobacteraceae bacterium]|jgi:dihydroflavonol-4-reductase|nr:NAD-dependent epimerase/dehydratase family protein [Bryobacteraceae bacterium]
MPALVTGAGGLIGANICRALLRRGYSVRALLRPGGNPAAIRGLPVEVVYGDVRHPETLVPAITGCDVVFHTASIFSYAVQDEIDMRATAVDGASNVLIAAKSAGAKRVVLTSSSVVFGNSEQATVRDEKGSFDPSDASPYFLSKVKQEDTAARLAQDLELDLVIVNPGITVGPHDTKLSPSNAIVIAYLSDPFHTTFEGGCNIVSVRDVAEGHVLAAERGVRNERYLLGSENLEWSLIHRYVAELCGVPAPRVYANHTVGYLAATIQEMWAKCTGTKPLTSREQAKMIGRFYWYSHSKAAAALGYSPGSARAALADAIAYLIRTPHVSTQLRRTLAPGKEVYDAQIQLNREEPRGHQE